MSPRYDEWIVQDSRGVTHVAKIGRVYDDAGALLLFQVSTACHPIVTQLQRSALSAWLGGDLPPVILDGRWDDDHRDDLVIIKYRLREAPTCVRCVATPKVF